MLVIESIYRLFQSEKVFVWEQEQQNVMNILKLTLISALTMIILNYEKDAKEIILIVNVSLWRWDAILMQVLNEKHHSFRYESDIWLKQKSRYNVKKRECRDLLKILKKVRYYLYEVKFTVKINANTLVAQLNRTVNNLSKILVTQWLI